MASPFLFVPLGSGGALGCAGGTGEMGVLLSPFYVLDVGSHWHDEALAVLAANHSSRRYGRW
jgi:hypothetical protein